MSPTSRGSLLFTALLCFINDIIFIPTSLENLLMTHFESAGTAQSNACRPHGVVVIATGFGENGLQFQFYKSTTGICQEGHSEFKVLRCSSKDCGSKASVKFQTYI